MKTLIYSHVFLPNYGGSGQVARMLAEGFAKLGHEVTIVTETGGPADTGGYAYRLHRGFSSHRFYQLARASDAVLLISISLKALFPALAAQRPVVVSHHMMAGNGWLNIVKRHATRLGVNVAVSGAVARSFGFPMAVIGNPYDDAVFRPPLTEQRSRDFVFLGRVIDCKGLHVLVEALGKLRDRGRQATLTVIGDGDALPAVQRQVVALGLEHLVAFEGRQDGESITSIVHNHRAIVVPSLWDEPFGIVALEGMACGCIPVVAESGGLPEAVGRCGLTYPRHDVDALAECLERVLTDEALVLQLLSSIPQHLLSHRKNHVAAAYLDIMHAAMPQEQSSGS